MGWRIVPLLMVFVGLAHFNRLSISVAGAERIIPSGVLTETQMGFVYSAFLFAYTLCMIPAGWIIDRYGPYAAWCLVGAGSATGAVLIGVVGTVLVTPLLLLIGLIAARAFTGVTSAPLHPSAARLVAHRLPLPARTFANGLVTSAATVGIASCYYVFGALLDVVDWPRAYLVTGTFTGVLTLIWWRYGRPPSQSQEALPQQGFPQLGDRRIVLITFSYGAVSYFQYLFFYWSQYYFEHVLEFPKDASRAYSSLLVLMMGLGMIAGGWLSDRVTLTFGPARGTRIVPMAGLLIGAAATAFGAMQEQTVVIVASFAVAMTAVGACEAAYWTTVVTLGGTRGGSAAAIMNTGGNALGLLAPLLTPLLALQLDWHGSLLTAAVICMAGALAWVGLTPDPISR